MNACLSRNWSGSYITAHIIIYKGGHSPIKDYHITGMAVCLIRSLRFQGICLFVGFPSGGQRKGHQDNVCMNSDSISTMVYRDKEKTPRTPNSRFLHFKRVKRDIYLWCSASMLSPRGYPSLTLNLKC